MRIHIVRDASHDGYEITTVCGIDGWRNDGLSQYYRRRGSDRGFHAVFEGSLATCRRCIVNFDPAPPSQGEAYHSDTIEGAKRLAQADFDRRIIGVAVIQRDDVLDDLHSTVCLLETMAEALPADDASGVMMSVMAENMRKKHFGGETEVKQ